jgi:hypothetical protein
MLKCPIRARIFPPKNGCLHQGPPTFPKTPPQQTFFQPASEFVLFGGSVGSLHDLRRCGRSDTFATDFVRFDIQAYLTISHQKTKSPR